MVVILLITVTGCGAGTPTPQSAVGDIDGFFKERGGLKTDEDITAASWYRPGDSLTDWIVIFEAGSGQNFNGDRYLEDLRDYVEKAYATEEKIDRVKATEWQRIALAIIACGGDPTSFGKDGKGGDIDLVRDGTYGWTHTEELDGQGSNALIYALQVIKESGVKVPKDAGYTEDSILERLMGYVCEDGGFSLAGDASDVDITSMAVRSLSYYMDEEKPYVVRGEEKKIRDVIDEAVDYLADNQSQGGYYSFGGMYSSDTTSQVVMALCSVNIDPSEDERFEKAGSDPVDALMTFRNEDGGFASAMDSSGSPEESDMLATCQAGNALIALLELEKKN